MTRVDTVADKVTRKVRKRVKEHSTGNDDLKVSSNKKRKLTSKSGRVKKNIKRVKSEERSDKTNGKSSASNTQGSASNSGKVHKNNTSRTRLKQRLENNGSDASLNIHEVTGYGIKDGEAIRYTRVATGKDLIPGLDGRTYIAQRLKEQYGGIVEDMGGEDQMSTIERALSKQMASLITIGEDMIAQRCIDDPEYDYLEHLACVKTVNQVGRTLGTKRRMKIVKEQKLEDYIEGKVVSE